MFMTPDLIVIRESSVVNCDIIWIRLNSDRRWSSMSDGDGVCEHRATSRAGQSIG